MTGPTMTILKLRNEMIDIIDKYNDTDRRQFALNDLLLNYIGNDTIRDLFNKAIKS